MSPALVTVTTDRRTTGAKFCARDCALSGAKGCYRVDPLGLQILVLISAWWYIRNLSLTAVIVRQHMNLKGWVFGIQVPSINT